MEVNEEMADIGRRKAELLILLATLNSTTTHEQSRASLVAEYKDLHERENYLLIDF